MAISVGVDVGGQRKGFHAVALDDSKFVGKLSTVCEFEVKAWCKAVGAQIVAVDSPCRWSLDGRSRLAERELMNSKIWCYSTPSRQIALESKKGFYGWVFQGEKLYQAIENEFKLYRGGSIGPERACIETFPHAITWQALREGADASQKRLQRRELLRAKDVSIDELTNIDLVDAALCALTGSYALQGKIETYGELESGLIVVPLF